jgi:glycosyltransferase involved in cell wall biosynthesis
VVQKDLLTLQKLDVVIIGKNEAQNLKNVLLSIQRAAEELKRVLNIESCILYVDSNSTDSSIEISSQLGVAHKVITQDTNAAKARNYGLKYAKGDYVQFVDGDTEINKEWLVKGIEFLNNNNLYVGVGGILEFKIYDSGNNVVWQNKNYRNTTRSGKMICDGVGGTFLFKSKILKEIGGFNDLYSVGEEYELYLRLLSKHHAITRIVFPMGIHHDQKTSYTNFIQKYLLTANIFLPGKTIQSTKHNIYTFKAIICRYWLEIAHTPIIIMILWLGINNRLTWSLLLLIVLLLMHFSKKKFDILRAVVSIMAMTVYSFGLYVGVLGNSLNPRKELD